MWGRGTIYLAVLVSAALYALTAAAPRASAATRTCAPTTSLAAGEPAVMPPPSSPAAGHPCWTDVRPYPFGSDGDAVDPSSPPASCGASAEGPGWTGDFEAGGNGAALPCYLVVTSMAFRAWNRGLAATAFPSNGGVPQSRNAYVVWLYNGTTWYPDPTFPGGATCPGGTVLWAGKLDYWLVGQPRGQGQGPQQTLCRFDGVSLEWEPLKLPAATVARLPVDTTGARVGGVTSGTCFAWDRCTFFGTSGIVVHWDGRTLSDASVGPGPSPWLTGDFMAAAAGADGAGNPFALAVTAGGTTAASNRDPGPVPSQPDGSPPPQVFSSAGGPFGPAPYTPPPGSNPRDPNSTDLVAAAADQRGDAWVAEDPAPRTPRGQGLPAPLLPLSPTGSAQPCAGYDAGTFTFSSGPTSAGSYIWRSLSVFPDTATALAGARYQQQGSFEPALVLASCGQAPALTRFVRPDPRVAAGAGPPVPADGGSTPSAVVAANAPNDAWSAATDGQLPYGDGLTAALRPHVYRLTDGQPPAARAGDDRESRPSLFTFDPPVYVPAPPAVVVTPVTITTTSTRGTARRVKLRPALYGLHTHLLAAARGRFTLVLSFRLRRPVSLGVQGLLAGHVVASSGVRKFRGQAGELRLTLERGRWPTRLRFVNPQSHSR